MEGNYIYDTKHKSRGKAVIINNNFEKSKVYCSREKASKDVTAIQNRLSELGFDTDLNHDLSAHKMQENMVELGKEDHSNSDCFMCVIMSYGDEGLLYGDDEKPIELKKLLEPFKGDKCKSLAGKPKIFFVQACPLRLLSESDAAVWVEKKEYKTVKIPVEADFLTMYSVLPGHRGWNDSTHGNSWFVGALSDVINDHHDQLQTGKLDLLRLMTRVNNKVWQKLKENNETKLKLPCVTSLLTKLIYFPEK